MIIYIYIERERERCMRLLLSNGEALEVHAAPQAASDV